MRPTVIALILASSLTAQTAVYPTNVVTDKQLKVQVNGMQTLLSSAITNVQTTIPVSACGTIPANSLATIDQEIVAIANCSMNVVTLDTTAPGCSTGRGCDSSIAAPHATSAPFSLYVDAWHHNSLKQEVEAIETALGASLANVVRQGNPVVVPSLTVTGAEVVGGTLGVTGGATFTGALTTGGTTTIGGPLVAQSFAFLNAGFQGSMPSNIGVNSVNPGLAIVQNGSGPALTLLGGQFSQTGTSTGSNSLWSLGQTGSGQGIAASTDVGSAVFVTVSGSSGTGVNAFATGTTAATAIAATAKLGTAVLASTTNAAGVALSASATGTGIAGEFFGNVYFAPVAFAALPSCVSGLFGYVQAVNDSTTNTWGATITGSGGDSVLAFCDGSAWTVFAK